MDGVDDLANLRDACVERVVVGFCVEADIDEYFQATARAGHVLAGEDGVAEDDSLGFQPSDSGRRSVRAESDQAAELTERATRIFSQDPENLLVYSVHNWDINRPAEILSVSATEVAHTGRVINDIVTPAVAGVLAGLGVAMPLGAVAALLLREGLVNGFRTAAAGAAGVATVDLVYCIIAALTGATFAPLIEDHSSVFLLTSGVLIVAIGVRQLWQGMRQPPRAAAEVERASAPAAFGRFVGLTAINPITLVYFIALSGAVTHSDASWIAPVIFVAAVGGASLAWQLLLARVGSAFGGALSLSATRAIGVIASFLIVALGMVAVVNGAAALG